MGFLRKLLASLHRQRRSTAARSINNAAALLAQIEARAAPCVRVVAGGDGGSRLGGTPDMAGAWPRYKGRPLTFIAQIDLTAVRAANGPDWLPTDGRLLFFYEFEHGAWGIDPKDLGSFEVRHELSAADRAIPPDAGFKELPVTFTPALSYPDQDRFVVNWGEFSSEDEDALEAGLVALAHPEPAHQIGGYADAIQNDGMEMECERVTSGLFKAKGKNDGGKPTGPGDWRLLLQLDTDNDAGMMWGDTGRLYFWVREQDARMGDFSKVWMILQCY